MYRVAAALLLTAALFCGGISPAAGGTAASVSSAELRQATLSIGDLPGFRLVNEDSPDGEELMQATWGRIFVALDASGNVTARLGVLLLAPMDSVPDARLASLVSSGELHGGITDSPNFQLTPPLGIGALDQPAVWNDYDRGSRTWKTDYAETFLRGRLVVHLIYETSSDVADPTRIAELATLQDDKVRGSTGLANMVEASLQP